MGTGVRSKVRSKTKTELLEEIAELKSKLEVAEETLGAIRQGEVDALVVSDNGSEQVFTLCGEQEPYRIFVETMNEGAAMVSEDGTIVYSNKHFAELVKMPLEKVMGSSFHQLVPEDGRPILNEFHSGKGSGGYRLECALKAPDGTLVPVLLSARAMEAGGIRSLCLVATDMTDRKLAEERARKSEQQIRLIFEQIPAVVWTTDRFMRILEGSGAGLTALNLPVEKVVGKTMQEFLDDPEGKSVPMAAHRAALKGEHRSYEHNFNGAIFSVNVQPLRDAEGRISGTIGVALDVTEAKRVFASTAKLAAIVESSQDAIMGATLGGYITSWNRGAEQMYGYSAEEVVGQHVSILAPKERTQETSQVLERLKQGETVKPYETVRRRKDGTLIDVSKTVSAVKDASGRMIGISAIAHDLSDRKKVETELRKLSARLLNVQDEAQRRMARELHDGVVQELAAAVINLSMVKDTPGLLPEARQTLEEALKITESSVREIRTFSYLLHPPLLDAMGLQSALRWYVEGYSKRSGVDVKLHLPENGRARMAKEVELTLFRIVQEALTNIHRHSGGHRATIYMKQTDEDLTLTVSDDGNGMDAETLRKVRREGTVLGVGIAGMKQRLQQLGGQLIISSGSTGTTVTVRLPIAV